MHVVERQAHGLQRLLPGRHAGRLPAPIFWIGIGDIGFRAAKLHAAGRNLVFRQTFLQRGFGLALQLRIDGRMHRVGLRGQAIDAVGLGFAAEKIDEVEAAVAVRQLEGDQLRQRRERLCPSARR